MLEGISMMRGVRRWGLGGACFGRGSGVGVNEGVGEMTGWRCGSRLKRRGGITEEILV